MKIFELLDELVEEIEDSPKAVFSSRRSIDYEVVMEIIGDLRKAMPMEVEEAEHLVKEKETIIAAAREEAESIVKSAEDELSTRVSETAVMQEAEARAAEIIKAAEAKAEEITRRAESNAKEITLGAKEYADDILAELETYFSDYLKVLRKNRLELSGRRKGGTTS